MLLRLTDMRVWVARYGGPGGGGGEGEGEAPALLPTKDNLACTAKALELIGGFVAALAQVQQFEI
jgi:hypothetical protein